MTANRRHRRIDIIENFAVFLVGIRRIAPIAVFVELILSAAQKPVARAYYAVVFIVLGNRFGKVRESVHVVGRKQFVVLICFCKQIKLFIDTIAKTRGAVLCTIHFPIKKHRNIRYQYCISVRLFLFTFTF